MLTCLHFVSVFACVGVFVCVWSDLAIHEMTTVHSHVFNWSSYSENMFDVCIQGREELG